VVIATWNNVLLIAVIPVLNLYYKKMNTKKQIVILSSLTSIQTLQAQCNVLLIMASENKFDEKKIVRGPGGRFGEKKDEKKESVASIQPQISTETLKENEQVEKITNTARQFAFGKNALAKIQEMVNSLKNNLNKNQVFREAQKAIQELQGKKTLESSTEAAGKKIKEIVDVSGKQSSFNKEKAAGVTIAVAIVLGGIFGVVQKKKVAEVVENLLSGKKIDLNINDLVKNSETPGSQLDVEKATAIVNDKLQESIKDLTKRSQSPDSRLHVDKTSTIINDKLKEVVKKDLNKSIKNRPTVWDNVKRKKSKKKELISFDINRVPVKMEIVEQVDVDDPINTIHRQVEFKVRDSLDKTGVIDKETANKIGLRLVKVFREVVKESKENTVFRCAPHIQDGAGEMRTKAYTLMGFGTPDRPGDFMYGIVKNGKLEPYYPDLVAYETLGLVD
jgi:hypothetical protein